MNVSKVMELLTIRDYGGPDAVEVGILIKEPILGVVAPKLLVSGKHRRQGGESCRRWEGLGVITSVCVFSCRRSCLKISCLMWLCLTTSCLTIWMLSCLMTCCSCHCSWLES